MWLQDLDLVKLTAQFVARNGKGFLTDLAMKEARNMEFNFLKPTHSMFTFFTALCDAYSKVRGTYNTSLQQHFSVFIFTKSSKDGQAASFRYSLCAICCQVLMPPAGTSDKLRADTQNRCGIAAAAVEVGSLNS